MNIPFPGLSMFIHISIIFVKIIFEFLVKVFWQKKKGKVFRGFGRRKVKKANAFVKTAINAFSFLIIITVFTITAGSASLIFFVGVTSESSNIRLAQGMFIQPASAIVEGNITETGLLYTMIDFQRSIYIYE